MLINFFSLDGMYSTFCDMYGIKEEKLKDYLDEYDEDKDIVSQFCDYFDFKLDVVDISGNELLCRHFTTAIDAGKSIEKNGMMSLKELLSEETVFKAFLADNGIVIDINKMSFKYKDNMELSLAEDECDSSSKLHFLSVALNHDNGELEAFYCGDYNDMYNYSTVKNYPEILRKIDDVIGELYGSDNKGIASAWMKLVNRKLMIEFSIELSNISYCNGVYQDGMGKYEDYMQETYEFIDSYPQCALINRWLIRAILSCLHENDVNHNCNCVGVKNPRLIRNIRLVEINGVENNG